jgi:hypothetical protein
VREPFIEPKEWNSPHQQQRVLDYPSLFSQMIGLRTASSHTVRSFPVNKYVLFYAPTGEGVRLIRVLYTSHDLPPLF